MLIKFTSNDHNLYAEVDAINFADHYLWLTIGTSVHMFSNVTTFSTQGSFLESVEDTNSEDVTDLIKYQSCGRYEQDIPAEGESL